MSTAPALDERKHREAIKALLTAAVGPNRVYDYGKVPGADGNEGTLPPIFLLVSVERRYVEPQKGGQATRSGWRVNVRYAGSSVNEADWAAWKVTQALDGARLVIDGATSLPVVHELSEDIAPDGGRFAGRKQWIYAL